MTTDNFNVKTPLELPKAEYDQQYFIRIINQLRLNFQQFNSPKEIREVQDTYNWFIS
tara:strand:- start:141 stop:311 length:171 start_codon:yes stop_codon:yes gene_type:complete